jgi:DNA-directed RNA polymerase specialized sigma24 family protein
MANPAAYVFRVGQNKARKLLKRSRWLSRDEIVFTEPWAEPGLGPAWSSLSDRQRVVVGLVHGFDWSLSEVADLLGISKGAAQTYEKRAMRRLRRDLGVDL